MCSSLLRWVFAVVIAVLLGSGLLGVRTAFADYFRYTDSSGTVCLTNDLKSIPERYRKKAVLVSRDAPKAEQAKPAVSQPPADQATEEAVSQPRAPEGFRERAAALFTKERMMTALKIVGAIMLVVAAYTGIGMLAAYLGCRQIGTVVRIVFTLGVLVYGFVMYADRMSAAFSRVKGEVTSIQQKSEKRSNQTGEQAREGADDMKVLNGQVR